MIRLPDTERHAVAIVDDNPLHRTQVAAALLSFYRIVEYPTGHQALAGLKKVRPALVIMGERAHPYSGIELTARLRKIRLLDQLPIIFIADTDAPDRLEAVHQSGVTTHLVKPYWRSTLIKTISGLVNCDIEQKWETLPPTQRAALKETLDVFNSISDVIEEGQPIAYATVNDACAPLVEAVNSHDFRAILHGIRDHDNYSYAHSLRVATLLALFGYTIGLPPGDQKTLATGGLLHDVGKMSIPYEVLNKPGHLTPREFEVMKSHVAASVRYLRAARDVPSAIVTIAEQHHEKLDGSGYPRGLRGGQLNELARMASIVDVFSALTDRRVYKPPMPAEVALRVMTTGMAGHLDGHLLNLFGEMLLDAALDTAPETTSAPA